MSDLINNRSVLVLPARGRGYGDHFASALALAWRTSATRRGLADLSDQQLADIGLTRAAAVAEAARLPWDTRPVRLWRRTGGAWAALLRVWERMRARRLAGPDPARRIFWGG